MTPDQERWAEALQVIKMKHDGALAFVAERIAALTAENAPRGVARWREIEERVRAVREAERAPQ